jgi:hypothetical protein
MKIIVNSLSNDDAKDGRNVGIVKSELLTLNILKMVENGEIQKK